MSDHVRFYGSYDRPAHIGAREGILCKTTTCRAYCTGRPEPRNDERRLAVMDGHSSRYTIEATVQFDADLPNGSYAKLIPRTQSGPFNRVEGTDTVKMNVFVPEKSTGKEMAAAVEYCAQKVLQQQVMRKKSEDGAIMSFEWSITGIEYKGGPFQQSNPVSEGTYELKCSQVLHQQGGLPTLNLRSSQNVCVCCCTVS